MMSALFTLMANRYERGIAMITGNLPLYGGGHEKPTKGCK
jgi:hypothetical protein